MTKKELTRVYDLAKDTDKEVKSSSECDGIMYWDNKQPVSLEGAAGFIRWQSINLNGTWDSEALSDCFYLLGKKALLIG